MNLKVYQYEKCGTCRKALKFLADHGIGFKTIPIREQPPSPAELKRMLKIYGGEVRRLFNTSGKDYQELQLSAKLPHMGVAEALALLAQNGNLAKRPFVLAGSRGRVGFNEKEWLELLED